MENIVFYYEKDSGKFVNYQIIHNKTDEEVLSLIKEYESRENQKFRYKLIAEPDVKEAILKKIEKATLEDIKEEILDALRSVEDMVERIKWDIEEQSK